MAQFYQEPNPTNDPNYLGSSRGFDRVEADKSLGSLFSGIGEVVGAGARGLETAFKDVIRNDLYKEVDKVRSLHGVDEGVAVAQRLGSESVGAGVGGQTDEASKPPGSLFPTGGTSKGAPPGVAKVGERIQRLQNVYQQGGLSNSAYYARLEAIAKEARSRYPGFREDIDNILKDITGVTPANSLRSSLLQDLDNAQRNATSATTQRLNKIMQLGPELASIYGQSGVQAILENRFSKTDSEVFAAALYQKGLKTTAESVTAINAASESTDKLSAHRQEGVTLGEAANISSLALTKITQEIERQTGKSFSTLISEAAKTGATLPKDVISNSIAVINAAETEALTELNNLLNRQVDVDPATGQPRTRRTILKEAGVKNIRENIRADFKVWRDAIESPNFGILHGYELRNKMALDQGMSEVLKKYPGLTVPGALVKIFGNTVGTTLLQDPDIANLPSMKQMIIRMNLGGATTEKPGGGPELSFPDRLNKWKEISRDRHEPLNPKDIRSEVDFTSRALLNPKVNPQERALLAESTYKDTSALNYFPQKDGSYVAAYLKLTSPAHTQAMLAMDTARAKEYENFVFDGARGALTYYANTLQSALENNPNLRVRYNPTSGLYEHDLGLKGKALPGGTNAIINRANDQTRQSVDRINAVLRNVQPLLKAQGKDPNEWLQQEFGFNPEKPAELNQFTKEWGPIASIFWTGAKAVLTAPFAGREKQ